MKLLRLEKDWAVVSKDPGDKYDPKVQGAHFGTYDLRVNTICDLLIKGQYNRNSLSWCSLWEYVNHYCAIISRKDYEMLVTPKENEFGIEVP